MKIPRIPFTPKRTQEEPIALQPDPPQEPEAKSPVRRFAPVIASVVTFFLGVAIGSTPSNADDAAATLVASPSPVPTVTVTATARPSATPTVTATVTATPEPAPTVTVTEAAQTEPEVEQDVQQGVVQQPAAPTQPEPASVYYANCSAARAAGAAPLYSTDPGYRSGLDRDGDGIACE